jgi:hypothetical protein
LFPRGFDENRTPRCFNVSYSSRRTLGNSCLGTDFAWKHSLGEARDENRIETQPAGGLDWADQDPTVTVWWGRDSSLQQ